MAIRIIRAEDRVTGSGGIFARLRQKGNCGEDAFFATEVSPLIRSTFTCFFASFCPPFSDKIKKRGLCIRMVDCGVSRLIKDVQTATREMSSFGCNSDRLSMLLVSELQGECGDRPTFSIGWIG